MSRLDRCYNVDSLRSLAKKKLPGVMFDYIDGGSESEITVGRNIESFQNYEFLARTLQSVETIDLKTKVFGVDSSMPIICAPTGMTRMFHYKGESAVSRAASTAGIPYCLSTVSTVSLEQIAKESDGSKFFQLYAWKNKQLVDELIHRCNDSGYDGLMLAVDLATLGYRERDIRNGHERSHEIALRTALGSLLCPAWLYRFLTSGQIVMANMVEHLPNGGDAIKTANTINDMFDSTLNWDEAKRLRDGWKGPFALKGIQCLDDAIAAVEIGATAIVLSNHGGRQLDGVVPAMDILPEVVAAVGDKIEIIIDGGIRRGSDVIKALALGADACMIGRPYLYGLAAGGEEGVSRTLDIFRRDMERTMRLIGCASLADLNPGYLRAKSLR